MKKIQGLLIAFFMLGGSFLSADTTQPPASAVPPVNPPDGDSEEVGADMPEDPNAGQVTQPQ